MPWWGGGGTPSCQGDSVTNTLSVQLAELSLDDSCIGNWMIAAMVMLVVEMSESRITVIDASVNVIVVYFHVVMVMVTTRWHPDPDQGRFHSNLFGTAAQSRRYAHQCRPITRFFIGHAAEDDSAM